MSHLYWLGMSRVFESERGHSSPTASTCMEPGVGGREGRSERSGGVRDERESEG